jgi:AcrR family transcriptional regulator
MGTAASGGHDGAPPAPRVSRQKEAGEATRRETRRRLLVSARAEFAERAYAAATVNRIAERAGVSVQTLYNDWGGKRHLLHAVMGSALTGDDDIPLEAAGLPLAVLTATLDPADAADPRRLLAHLVRQYRLPAQALRPGLSHAAAADTAWVIASPTLTTCSSAGPATATTSWKTGCAPPSPQRSSLTSNA